MGIPDRLWAGPRIEEKLGKDTTIPARYENGIFRPLEKSRSRKAQWLRCTCRSGASRPAIADPVKGLPLYGLWADRDDITDDISYVDDLRRRATLLVC